MIKINYFHFNKIKLQKTEQIYYKFYLHDKNKKKKAILRIFNI
jgi:hypothetical protein